MTENVCPQCAVFGRTSPYKNNSCYFNSNKMTDRRGLACKLMDEKGVACHDNDWRQGTEKTVLHRNSIKENLSYKASLGCSPTPSYISTIPTKITVAVQRFLPQSDTAIADSGATHLYIFPSVPHGPPNTSALKSSVGTATGHVERSSATATLPILQLAADFSTTGYIMPSFTKKLVGVGPIYNADCTVLFTKKDVTVFSPGGKSIPTGWREK